MLNKPFQFVLAAAALAAPASAFASEPARSADPAASRAEAPAPRSPRGSQPELICRTVDVPGADAAAMVCMTAIDWRRAGQ